MTPVTLTTHGLAACDQFAAWHEWYAPIFHTAVREPPNRDFGATATVWTGNGFGLSRVVSPRVAAHRDDALVRRNPVDHWCIGLSKESPTHFRIRDREGSAPARVPYVYSLAEEMWSERSAMRLQLYLARDSFQPIAPALDAAVGTAFDLPGGRLLSDFILLLERHMPQLQVEHGSRLATSIQAMVAACLAPSAGAMAEARRPIDATLMERVRRAVRKNLRSRSLGPDTLCREAATSRSQLYRLLEREGGVAHYIQRSRLAESFALLCDPANGDSIGKIAELLCFADGSSFSRAFRREFGVSPSDARAAALVGGPVAPSTNKAVSGAPSFEECLQSL